MTSSNSVSQFSTSSRHYNEQYRVVDAPKKIHILGLGSIGKFVAHSLRSLPEPPPVTLLLHRPALITAFQNVGNRLDVRSPEGVAQSSSGYEAELALPQKKGPDAEEYALKRSRVEEANEEYLPGDPIYNLIVTTKGQQTVSAIGAIRDRLTPESTILFMQNGVGIVDEVNELLFPDISTRPNYMLGINSHGVHVTGSFSAIHAGHGTISLGLTPKMTLSEMEESGQQPSSEEIPPSARYMLRSLTRSPVLAAVAMSPSEIFQAQLDKLAVNCVLNPLTVMMDCRNGDILYNHALSRTMRLLIIEICHVIQSLPELKGIPNISSKFSTERLENLVVSTAEKTARNISSTLADVRRGRKTEIKYMNGYIVRRGEEMGIKPILNYMVMKMVEGKRALIARELEDYSPHEHTRRDRGSSRSKL